MDRVPASRNAHEHRLYLQNMKTTFSQSGCCNQQGYETSDEGHAQLLTGTR